ncbi:MAG TPA: hypothetical protein VFW60_10255 [Rhodanobacteraceae bacterium]|nr:hypothetical protein [Rhodanobacteraceae bacterium]
MKRKLMWLLTGLIVLGGTALGGCVVAPRRAHVVAVAPARVWVPGHWVSGHVWVRGHWRLR